MVVLDRNTLFKNLLRECESPKFIDGYFRSRGLIVRGYRSYEVIRGSYPKIRVYICGFIDINVQQGKV